MIRIKIDKNKKGEPNFKLQFKKIDEREERFLKRALMEGREIKGSFKYEIPLRFFMPIIRNIKKENLKVDRYSKNTFYEFSDRYDEKYYYSFEINAKYMKKWRQEECPDIFKVEIDSETLELKKEVVFKKIDRRIKDA